MYIAEDRTPASLGGFWETLTDEQVASIAAVAMDMWDPFTVSVREHVAEPDDRIGFDKLHIAKHQGKEVPQVRRRENKTLRTPGDDRLAGTRYDWLRNPAAMEPENRREFAAPRNSNLKTARAWALKEAGMALFSQVYQLHHRITNAASQSISSKTQWVKYTVRRFAGSSPKGATSVQ